MLHNIEQLVESRIQRYLTDIGKDKLKFILFQLVIIGQNIDAEKVDLKLS